MILINRKVMPGRGGIVEKLAITCSASFFGIDYISPIFYPRHHTRIEFIPSESDGLKSLFVIGRAENAE